MLEALREAAIARGRVAFGETDEVVYAYATVHELAERVVAPPAFYVYRADATARKIDVGRAVAHVLTELGLADADAVADLRFDALWAVLAGQLDAKSWSISLDFYNLLVIELVRQVCSARAPSSPSPWRRCRTTRCTWTCSSTAAI